MSFFSYFEFLILINLITAFTGVLIIKDVTIAHYIFDFTHTVITKHVEKNLINFAKVNSLIILNSFLCCYEYANYELC
jgi:hypothetical protein